MAEIKEHGLVKGFAGITFSEGIKLEQILVPLQERFGPLDSKSDVFNFDPFTDFYQDQMGISLKKIFVSFLNPVPVGYLPEMKCICNQLENEFVVNGNRTANIDPGYLTHAKVVLATTKDYSHRLYLDKGIFGDLHLVYRNKSYQSQPWTYPDYQQKLSIVYFNELKEIFYAQQSGIPKNS